jgi:hypothetical protein
VPDSPQANRTCSSVRRVPSLRPDAIQMLDRSREVHVTTPRKRLSVWAVVVDGEAYVRSYRGERGAWYRRALREGRVEIEGIAARVERERDPKLNERISDAFRAKYGERSPSSTDAMVTPEVAATTLRLVAPE